MQSVAAVYYDLGGRLGLDAIAQRIEALPAEGHWQTLAKNALRDDLAELQRVLTRDVVALPVRADDPRPRVEAWEATNALARERARSVVDGRRRHGARRILRCCPLRCASFAISPAPARRRRRLNGVGTG